MKTIILVINPGSTSTKVSLFDEKKERVTQTIRHTHEELSQFNKIVDQREFRKKLIVEFIVANGYTLDDLRAVVGRGGLLKPIIGGTYLIDDSLLNDLIEEKYNTHASNLGAILAHELASLAEVDSYIVDPVVVDEMNAIARLSGLKGIERRSVGHALNQKAVARKTLQEAGKVYENSNVIVAHLGGGISVAAHENGKMVDVVNGLDGEGAFSPERTGSLPLYDFALKIINEKLNIEQVKKLLAGNGGIHSYLDEIDLRLVTKRIDANDAEAEHILSGMCYQIAKSIGEMAVVLKGQVDMIILTGGAAYSSFIVDKITEYTHWIADVKVTPGEREMMALYEGAMRVLNSEEAVKRYDDIRV